MDAVINSIKPSNKRVPQRSIQIVIVNIILFIFSISCIIPLIWLLYSTFKTSTQFEADVIALPKNLYLENYQYVITKTPILLYIWNTLRNTVLSMIGILFLGFVNGYFLSRFRFKGRNFLYGCYVSALFIPIHALLVPTYLTFSMADMNNKWFSTILPLIATQLTTTIFIISSYVKSIPVEMEEAASIDGSSFSRTMFGIILPMSIPALVTAGIIAFFHCWNEFSYSLVLIGDAKLFTISLSLTHFKGENRIDYPKMMTAMVISMLPALLTYILFSKRIIKGLVAGALKG